jgi:hypothetical protein
MITSANHLCLHCAIKVIEKFIGGCRVINGNIHAVDKFTRAGDKADGKLCSADIDRKC